jgi:hypothetical protein
MYGITSAIVFQVIMIGLGAATFHVRILFWVVSKFSHFYFGYNYFEIQYNLSLIFEHNVFQSDMKNITKEVIILCMDLLFGH